MVSREGVAEWRRRRMTASQNGGVAECRHRRMAAWQDDSVAEWRRGRMSASQSGFEERAKSRWNCLEKPNDIFSIFWLAGPSPN
jgi:hypothetical protein